MALNCIYHPTLAMLVVEDDVKEKFLATGFWFDHPNKAKAMREKYEKQIRRDQKQRSSNRKQSPSEISSGS